MSLYSLAAGLLRILCGDSNIREQVKVFDGIPICLRYLQVNSLSVWIMGPYLHKLTNNESVNILIIQTEYTAQRNTDKSSNFESAEAMV